MDRGSKEAGVKRIRIHDIRHSHVSHLIDMGFSAIAIADRVGHESIDITYRYSHLFPSKQVAMADKLDEVNAKFGDMDSETDEYVDAGDIGIESSCRLDGSTESEMIDLDAVNICNRKKSTSNGSGKVLSIEKYRAV